MEVFEEKLNIHSSSNRTEAAGMCGLCCSKSKLKQLKKNEDKEEQKDEKRFNGKNEKAFEPLQEEPTKLQHLQSLNEQDRKKQPEEEEKSMEEDKQTAHESLASDDEKMERKIPSRNEWMSDITGFPSFSRPKAIDKTLLPNMSNSSTERKEKPSKVEEISIDESEFPWTIPPVIEDSEEEDDEEETENYDDETEFPVNAPRVDSDDGGISFPYNKPPKYN